MALTERLEYAFESKGLSRLRRSFRQVESDLQDLDGRAEGARESLQQLEQLDTRRMQRGLGQATRSVTDLGDEAADTARRMERSFSQGADAIRKDIDGMSDALSSFTMQDAGVDIGGGGGFAATALLGAAGVGAGAVSLSQQGVGTSLGALTQQAQGSLSGIQTVERGMENASRNMLGYMDELRGKLGELSDTFREFGSQAAKQVADGLQEIADGAEATPDKVDGLLDAMNDLDASAEDADGSLAGLGARLKNLKGGAAAAAIAAVGAAAVTATAQVAALAAQVADYGQQLKVAEAQSGVAATEIQQIALAARALDSRADLDAVRDAFKELAIRSTEAAEGTGEGVEAFERLGISVAQLRRLEPAELFREVTARMRDLTAAQRITTAEQVLGGEAGERLARVFALQADELDRLLQITGRTALTQDQIDKLDAMRTEYTLIEQELRKIKQEFALAFGDDAIDLLEDMVDVTQQLATALSASGAALEAIRSVTTGEAFGAPEWLQKLLTYGPLGLIMADSAPKQTGASPGMPAPIRSREVGRPGTTATAQDVIPDSPPVKLPSLAEFTRRYLDLMKVFIRKVDPMAALEQLLDDKASIKSRTGQLAPGTSPEALRKMEARVKRSMNNVGQMFKDAGRLLEQELIYAADAAGYAIGQRLGGALFNLIEGGPSDQTESLRLEQEGLRQREAALRESLRKREISYREFGLRMEEIQMRMTDVTKQLNDEMASSWQKTWRSIGDFVERMVKQIIGQITAAISRALALMAINKIAGGGPLSFGSALGQATGLTGLASGGVVYGPTPALVGEYPGARSNPELIAPADKMQGYIREAVRQGGGGQTIHITGTTRTDGRDLITSYDATKRVQRRKGY